MPQYLVLFQCIDKARDLLDAELTAMAGESYSRAYGVSVALSLHSLPSLLLLTVSKVALQSSACFKNNTYLGPQAKWLLLDKKYSFAGAALGQTKSE